MILILAVAVGFQDTTLIGNAYVKPTSLLTISILILQIPLLSLHDSYVYYDISHGACHNLCVAKKCSTCHFLSPFILAHRRCLPVFRIHQDSTGRMGLPCALVCLLGYHVCLALWNSQEVQF
nr:uncharacterized protein LOC104103260 [Nicotiana tomentosiformis]